MTQAGLTHAELIDRLGGGTVVARALAQATGRKLDREAVYKWKVQGIPWRWRAHVRCLAEAMGQPVPVELQDTAVPFDAEAARSALGVKHEVDGGGRRQQTVG